MPIARFLRIDQALREKVLLVAAREFRSAGYDGASLNAIIFETGLSKGVFYYYFHDKADLAATVLEDACERSFGSLARFDPPAGDFDFWAFLATVTRETMADIRRSAECAELLSRLGTAVAREPMLAARLEPFVARAREVAERCWQRGQEVGAVRSDLSPALLSELTRQTKETMARHLLPADRAPTRDEEDRFIAAHLDIVRRLTERAP